MTATRGRTILRVALACGAGVLALAAGGRLEAQAILDNGTVQLGVDTLGQLNVDGGTPSAGGSSGTLVGLRHVATNYEGTAGGCLCEGWGIGDPSSNNDFGVDNAFDPPTWNLAPESFAVTGTGTLAESTGSSAVSVAIAGGSSTSFLRVTHDFHPSASPNLYEVTVLLENLTAAPLAPIYRRVMDWDVEPTAFSELVTIDVGSSTALTYANDNGFDFPLPLGIPTPFEIAACGTTTSFTDCGPADHGALFDFTFDPIAPGASLSFAIYYGAAASETEALEALSTVGAEVFSLGQCDGDLDAACDAETGTPVTFIFGFTGVGGEPILPQCSLTPPKATLPVGGTHQVTATVTADGEPVPGATVDFAVTSGPHLGTAGAGLTTDAGHAAFSYLGTTAGIDTVEATGEVAGAPFSCSATVIWKHVESAFAKQVVAGPDEDLDGAIDLVVEVGQPAATLYELEIAYANPGGPPVVVLDTVPAEWVVTLLDDDGGRAAAAAAGKKAKGATKLRWTPDATAASSAIRLAAATRPSPGRRNARHAPTSCGALRLNDGAAVHELGDDGRPSPAPLFGPTEVICLAAVRDLDGGGLVGDGSGDEDGDGLADHAEACGTGTDPCRFDTDGDGTDDGDDNCPLVANPAQNDDDGDGTGNRCDRCPLDAGDTCG